MTAYTISGGNAAWPTTRRGDAYDCFFKPLKSTQKKPQYQSGGSCEDARLWVDSDCKL